MANNQHSTKKLGMMFTLAGWTVGFLLLGLIFSKVLDNRHNPNQSVTTATTGAFKELVLHRNPYGHYLFNGEINRKAVTFLVDTGATTTAIPFELKDYLGITPGPAITVTTANGNATAYLTTLDELKLGDIVLSNVKASLNPGFIGSEILLGMNVLKHMELIQRNDTLTIRLNP